MIPSARRYSTNEAVRGTSRVLGVIVRYLEGFVSGSE